MPSFHVVIKSFSLMCLTILALITASPRLAQAAVLLRDVTDIAVAPEMLYFEDQTGSQSFYQAQTQFKRFEQDASPHDSSFIRFDRQGSVYWLKLTIQNQTDQQNWVLNLQPAAGLHEKPVWLQQIMVYQNDGTGKPIYTTQNNAIPMMVATQATADYLIMVKTIDGLDTAFRPILQPEQHFNAYQHTIAGTMTASWIVITMFATAALIFFILSRMTAFLVFGAYALVLIQGHMLTLDASRSLYGVLTGLLSPTQIFPLVACVTSLMAAILTMAMAKDKQVPFILKILLLALAGLIGCIIAMPGVITGLPMSALTLSQLIIMLSGLVLAVMALGHSFHDARNLWLLPAWLIFSLQTFMTLAHPLLLPVLHLALLGVGFVMQIYVLWQAQEKTRHEQQQKLQVELNQMRQQHEKENFMWERKLESERGLLNNAKQREALRSTQLAEAKAQADAANKAKSDFLAMISHEIRTPMTGIMGMVHLTAHTSLDDRQKEYIDTIQNAGETLLTLLNDVLDYSKLEKGAIVVERIPFGLRALVQAVVTLMSGRAHEKSLRLLMEIDPSVPDTLNGDPNRLRQILINLLSNAIKFTEQGSVTIDITRDPAVSQDNPAVFPLRIKVIDTGIGISKEAQEKLFSAYSQADASIARRFGGTGLGLNICRMLVQAMGGDIHVKSELNRGSTFWFTVMLDKATAEDAQQAARQDEELTHIPPLNVLVVDDNPVNLKVIAGLLELDHHHVTTVESGTKALNEIDMRTFDLIFMDIQMPGFDGLTITKAIRSLTNKQKANVPVYALTGMGRDEDEEACRAAGMNGILVKPVRVPAFKRILHDVAMAKHKTVLHEESMKLTDIVQVAKDVASDVKKTYDLAKDQVRRGLASDHIPADELGARAVYTPAPPPQAATREVMPPANADDVLNIQALKDLRQSLPPSSFTDIFAELDTKSDELVEGIIGGWAVRDRDDVMEKAHNLRGMAGNFGLNLLSQTAGNVEKALKAGHDDIATDNIATLKATLVQTKAALNDWLKT